MLSTLLPFSGRTPPRWRNSNSGLRASPIPKTLDWRSHPTPRRMRGHLGKARELTKRAVDSAIRADSKENGAIWQANAALRQAAFGNAYRSPSSQRQRL